jgi:hypothetical protein
LIPLDGLDHTRLYAIDARFEPISAHTGLRLYRPGYGGSFNDGDDA